MAMIREPKANEPVWYLKLQTQNNERKILTDHVLVISFYAHYIILRPVYHFTPSTEKA